MSIVCGGEDKSDVKRVAHRKEMKRERDYALAETVEELEVTSGVTKHL